MGPPGPGMYADCRGNMKGCIHGPGKRPGSSFFFYGFHSAGGQCEGEDATEGKKRGLVKSAQCILHRVIHCKEKGRGGQL